MTNSRSILNQLAAESLLEGSFVLKQIVSLRQSISTASDGDNISYDDYYERLQKQIDDLGSIQLQLSVAPGTENQYMVELIQTLDQVSSSANRVYSKAYKFLSMLKNAQGEVKKLSGVFVAWYTLAATEFITENAIKLPTTIVKTLGESEFSRLLGGLDSTLETFIVAVGIQIKQIDEHRKLQKEKFGYGQKQADSNFLMTIPDWGGHSSEPNTLIKLVPKKNEDLDEPEETVPDFVSRKPSVLTLTEVTNVPSLPTEPIFISFSDDTEIKGTFVKEGEPQPVEILAANSIDDILDAPSPEHTLTKISKRKAGLEKVDVEPKQVRKAVAPLGEPEPELVFAFVQDMTELKGLVDQPQIQSVSPDELENMLDDVVKQIDPEPVKEEPFHLVFVFNGEETKITTHNSFTLKTALERAVIESENASRPITDWEVRRNDGVLLEIYRDIKGSRLESGTKLYVSPKVGSGGTIPTIHVVEDAYEEKKDFFAPSPLYATVEPTANSTPPKRRPLILDDDGDI